MSQSEGAELVAPRSDTLVAYFGYGSLVNRATLRTAYIAAQPVRLRGWRRCWRPRSSALPARAEPNASLLSARQVPDSVIDGLLVFDHVQNLPAVDERETGYDRILVPPGCIQVLDGEVPDCPVYVYEAHTNSDVHDPQAPILHSYLDAVFQGFLNEFGKQGVHNFIRTTDGFDRAVQSDRHEPVYPRSVLLSADEQAFFDHLLDELGTDFV